MNKYRILLILINLQLISYIASAQIVENGSFLGVLGVNDPFNWSSCLQSSSTDILPGEWGVNLPAFEGLTYMGMVCRGNFNNNSNTCEEVRQDLNVMLEADKCYQLKIQLAYSNTFSIDVFRNPIKLNIYVGSGNCSQEVQIAEFGPVDNVNWQEYTVDFTLEENRSTIHLEADYASLPEYFGNILLDDLSITEIAPPVVDLGSDTILCTNETLILDAQNPGNTFLWSNGSTESTILVSEIGSYWVQVSTACTSYSDTISVNFQAAPVVDLGGDTILCNNETITLNAQNIGSAFLWNNGYTGPTILVDQGGGYWVEASNQCGNFRDTININYKYTPVIDLGNDTTLCDGEVIILGPGNSGDDFLWSNGSIEAFIPVSQGGNYWVETSNQCGNDTDTINISHEYIPVVDLGNDTMLCEGETLILDAENQGGSYYWNNNQTTQTILANEQGSYRVEITNQCFAYVDSIWIDYSSFPVVNLGEDTTICRGEELLLILPNNDLSYLWQDGSEENVYPVYEDGTYEFTATNFCGTYNATIDVQYEECECDVYIPNVFTPNNDGVNDYFRPLHRCDLSNYQFSIVTRWGEEVFYSESISEQWNGMFRGKLAPNGTYLYRVNYTSYTVSHTEYGTIHLLR